MFRIKRIPQGSLTSKAWSSLKRNTTAVVSMWSILAAVFIAMAGYLITPDSSPFANEQHLEIAAKKPGFSVQMLKIRNNELPIKQSFIKTLFYGRKSDYTYIPAGKYRFEDDRVIISLPAEGADSASLEFTYLIADVIYALPNTDPAEGNVTIIKDLEGKKIITSSQQMQKIIEDDHIIRRFYLLGTDRFGRDVLSQLMIGTRVSLSVGFISVLISLIFGILLGSLAGFFRGRVDDLIIWFINVIWSIPTLLLVIAITFALGKGFWQVFIAVGLTSVER